MRGTIFSTLKRTCSRKPAILDLRGPLKLSLSCSVLHILLIVLRQPVGRASVESVEHGENLQILYRKLITRTKSAIRQLNAY
jgi:hypothetical protein